MTDISGISPYQGGFPILHTRYRGGGSQRGAGFLSTIKRFLIPIAKTAMPHVFGAIGDVVQGKSALETLKSRGRAAGADVLHGVADHLRGPHSGSAPANRTTAAPPTSAPKKVYKRKRQQQPPQLEQKPTKKRQRQWN